MITNTHGSLIAKLELGPLDTEMTNGEVLLGQGWVLQNRQGATNGYI